jgi:hypothetical protein
LPQEAQETIAAGFEYVSRRPANEEAWSGQAFPSLEAWYPAIQ